MSRNNIFEMLHMKTDYCAEIEKIETLINEVKVVKRGVALYTIEDYVDDFCFMDWKNRFRCLSCEDMRNSLSIDIICGSASVDVDSFIVYIEYIANIFYVFELSYDKMRKSGFEMYNFKNIEVLSENIKSLLDEINSEIKYFKDKEMALVTIKNEYANEVAEIIDNDLAFSVIQYNHHKLNGDINKKKSILLAMGNSFKSKEKNLCKNNYKGMVDDIAFLLNNMNIRHNNIDKQSKDYKAFIASLNNNELEQWYDKTYNLLLLGFLADESIILGNEINELKKQINGVVI